MIKPINYKKAAMILNRLYDDKKLTKARKTILYDKYISLIRKAAYSGNPDAQFELGQYYEDVNFLGENKFYNPKKCFYWYAKAALNGHAEACNNLGYCYDAGVGVKRNLTLARKYYSRAANLGDNLGVKNLSLLVKST